jgi:hypothetical protein
MADDRQGRVLVVEDNEVNQVLARRLQDGGRIADGRWTGRLAASAGEVLDRRRLAELGGLDPAGNGPALIGRLLESFLARIPVDLADLRTAFHHGDSARALRVAHRLKGAAATVGSRQPRGPEAARPGGAG